MSILLYVPPSLFIVIKYTQHKVTVLVVSLDVYAMNMPLHIPCGSCTAFCFLFASYAARIPCLNPIEC